MTVPPDITFGLPWAPKDEERPHRYRIPLAWCEGAAGGALFLQFGLGPEPIRIWMTVDEWAAWVKKNNAAPVVPETADVAFDHTADEGDG